MCLVAWASNESEVGVDLVLIETSLAFMLMMHDAVLMLISRNIPKKSSELSVKTTSTPASLSFKGQATKYTIVNIKLSPKGEMNSAGYIPRSEMSRYISTALHRP